MDKSTTVNTLTLLDLSSEPSNQKIGASLTSAKTAHESQSSGVTPAGSGSSSTRIVVEGPNFVCSVCKNVKLVPKHVAKKVIAGIWNMPSICGPCKASKGKSRPRASKKKALIEKSLIESNQKLQGELDAARELAEVSAEIAKQEQLINSSEAPSGSELEQREEKRKNPLGAADYDQFDAEVGTPGVIKLPNLKIKKIALLAMLSAFVHIIPTLSIFYTIRKCISLYASAKQATPKPSQVTILTQPLMEHVGYASPILKKIAMGARTVEKCAVTVFKLTRDEVVKRITDRSTHLVDRIVDRIIPSPYYRRRAELEATSDHFVSKIFDQVNDMSWVKYISIIACVVVYFNQETFLQLLSFIKGKYHEMIEKLPTDDYELRLLQEEVEVEDDERPVTHRMDNKLHTGPIITYRPQVLYKKEWVYLSDSGLDLTYSNLPDWLREEDLPNTSFLRKLSYNVGVPVSIDVKVLNPRISSTILQLINASSSKDSKSDTLINRTISRSRFLPVDYTGFLTAQGPDYVRTTVAYYKSVRDSRFHQSVDF